MQRAGDGGSSGNSGASPPSAGTSAAATSTTSGATRSSSTGGPSCPARSTAPLAPSRWTCGCAAGSGSTRGGSPPTRTSTSSPRSRRDVGHSRILVEEIERPRVGPMRDIVATIQPEQDEIVRADAATTVCVQGAPGTGKTAVGLHRAAWLLYAFRDRLVRSGVLVVGPNRAFLDHIGAVLPALGEVEVRHTTAEELVARDARVRGEDRTAVAILKGDPRLATVLERAVWAHVRPAPEALVVPRGARKWRVPAYTVDEVVAELRGRTIRYEAARLVLPQRLAHHVLLAMERSGDSPDDRVQDAVARSAAVRAYAARVWPKLDPRQVLTELFSSAGALSTHASGVLSPTEQELLVWATPPRSKASAPWSGGGPGAARRAGRPVGADAQPRPRRPGRGAGPVADAAAGGGPALLDRFGDGAGRHRAGHHAVGHRLVVRVAGAPGQAGRPHRDPRPRVSGAGVGHRLRRATAAVDGAGARGSGLGARKPGPAGPRPGRAGGGGW